MTILVAHKLLEVIMQKGPNILPYHVQVWLMSEYHWICSLGKHGVSRMSNGKRDAKRRLNRVGRRKARLDLKNGYHDIRRARVQAGEEAI